MRGPVELRGDALYALYPALRKYILDEMRSVGGDDDEKKSVWTRMAERVYTEIGPDLSSDDDARDEPYVFIRQIGGSPQHTMGPTSTLEVVRVQVQIVVQEDDLSGGFFARGLLWTILDGADVEVECPGYVGKASVMRKEWVNVRVDRWWKLATDFEIMIDTS